jgi:hypothetical protein
MSYYNNLYLIEKVLQDFLHRAWPPAEFNHKDFPFISYTRFHYINDCVLHTRVACMFANHEDDIASSLHHSLCLYNEGTIQV